MQIIDTVWLFCLLESEIRTLNVFLYMQSSCLWFTRDRHVAMVELIIPQEARCEQAYERKSADFTGPQEQFQTEILDIAVGPCQNWNQVMCSTVLVKNAVRLRNQTDDR